MRKAVFFVVLALGLPARRAAWAMESSSARNAGQSTYVERWFTDNGADNGELMPARSRGQNRADPDSLVRQILRRAGLGQDCIQTLQEQSFAYPQVRQALEDAAVDQGMGRGNARRRANRIAQQVEQLSHDEDQVVMRPQRIGAVRGNDWRTQEIREKLEQAGLSDEVIQGLQRDGFVPSEIEDQVREHLLNDGYENPSAEQRAHNLANQIRGIRQTGNRALARNEEPPRTADVQAIRDLLRQSGLNRRQVDRLQRRDFPYDEVRVLTQDQLEDQGYDAGEAHRRALEIAAQVDQWREYSQPVPRRQGSSVMR